VSGDVVHPLSAVAVRSAVLSLAVMVSAGHTAAQTPPSFGTQAELVTVDVVVHGPDGKAFSGLTRDDFVVKEDGQPQTLKAFEVVERVVPAGSAEDSHHVGFRVPRGHERRRTGHPEDVRGRVR